MTADQKYPQPPRVDWTRIAASGSSTMTDSQMLAAPTRNDVVPNAFLTPGPGPDESPLDSGRAGTPSN
ncbi:hypothetical protein NCCNTM_13250 [Mycolicibacterium sp. NCC-Tsukiji]|nr:hypothetical protein NCCNTM_13250 [Mycolicibacterium sp. NCC-Tsukiji]